MKRPAAAAAVAPKKPKKDYPTVGTIIEAKWSTEFGPGKEWYRGKIAKVHAGKTSSRDPSFDVAYDDGELEAHVPAHSLQPAEEAETKAESEPLPFACTLFSSGVKSAGGMPGVPGGIAGPSRDWTLPR